MTWECDLWVHEDASEPLWNLLMHRCSASVLEQDLKRRSELHGNPTDRVDERATQAALCLSHASAYRDAAKSAPMSVRPLLLYYAAYSLSAALIVALSASEATLPEVRKKSGRGHGLTLKHKSCESLDLNKSTADLLASLRCLPTKSGTFRALCNVVWEDFATVGTYETLVEGSSIGQQSRSILARFCRRPNAHTWDSLQRKGISLLQLLAVFPEMQDVFEATGVDQGIRSLVCTATHRIALSDIDFLFIRCTCGDSAEANRVCNELCPEEWNAEVKGKNNEIVLANIDVRDKGLPISFAPAIESASGYLWLVLGEKPVFSQMSCLLAALYVLGMLVRYYPDTWETLTSKRSEVLRLFEVFCGEVLPRLAQHALNHLTGRLHYFLR